MSNRTLLDKYFKRILVLDVSKFSNEEMTMNAAYSNYILESSAVQNFTYYMVSGQSERVSNPSC